MLPSRTAAAERPRSAESADLPVFCLSLRAAAEVGVIARVVQQLARRSLLPIRWHSTVSGEHLLMDIQIAGLAGHEGELLTECLRQIVGMEEVLTADLLRRAAA